MTDTWPRAVLTPENERWSRTGRLVSGGQAVSGAMTGGRTDGGGLWVCQQQSICLDSPELIKLWRQLETMFGDGVTQFVMNKCEAPFRPRFDVGGQTSGIPHSDGTLHSDGTGYSQGEVEASAHAAAVRRATTITLEMELADKLTGGEEFSFTHPNFGKRLYSVGKILDVTGDRAQFQIWPPLREALTGGEAADFNAPGCTMKVANPTDFAAPLQSNFYGFADLTLVEAF